MDTIDFLFGVFLSQIILVSYYFPKILVERTENAIEQHPPSEYANLYPVSVETIKKQILKYRNANFLMMILGIFIFVFSIAIGADELLGWDSQSVSSFYFMLQMAPLIWVAIISTNYAKLLRKLNQGPSRKAQLSPRKLTDFIGKNYLYALAIGHITYIVLIWYLVQHPFDGFAGYINLLGLAIIDLILAGGIYYYVYFQKPDPLQPEQVRIRDTRRTVYLFVLSGMAVLIKLSVDLILSALDMRDYQDIVSCIYFQLIVASIVYYYRLSEIDFEVYRKG
ncbi:hypothetical protein [uncultured Paraglaciecola sp.]|uniref:hypothetical protein n=1 Tax=uncultured Paraglaciecola sp. TaxID=1765024 RepID=UPI0025F546E8|nr:hypothetical protein [uncultured Paraglaciecola sp.]